MNCTEDLSFKLLFFCNVKCIASEYKCIASEYKCIALCAFPFFSLALMNSVKILA